MKRAKLDKTHNTKKAKLDKTDTHSTPVAPQNVELEEEADDIDVVEVDVKVEGEEDHIKMERERWYEFSKYWSEYSPILAMAVVLDPRYKMQYVEITYKKLYGSSFREHSDYIREKLHDLFGEYVIESPMSYRAETISTSDSTHQYRYPELASMAQDILSIPVSTVASESTFSNGGRLLDQYRSSLKHENVEAIICAKDWFFRIKGDEELCLQDLTEDVMKLDNNANGTHEEMESQA
ncbi:unnamed protein product [Lactuca saligna]|uniref:HAT C-terminal dimerisation domain-containing protein n=1 Tax=Lactuca saligna TaxID=75948 RepID=A0AA35YP00_LACSI|nr:unnamed protein product [Lactuca saligna]